jgi:NADH-quinone oxidoreductase subunit N
LSTPLIWIVMPILSAVVLFSASRWNRLTVLGGILISLLLGLLAWITPINQEIIIGPWSFTIQEVLVVYGRKFTLGEGDRFILIIVYLLAAFWFGAAYVTQSGRAFVPTGLVMIALLTSALAVEPFLYAALLVELAALVSLPILVAPGKPAGRAVLRFISFQTIGMPFILFTGWMLSGIGTNPGDTQIGLRAALLLGFGFAFLLAVFPFHAWIPLLAEEAHTYGATFVLFLLPWMITLLGLGFLNRFTWLRNNLYNTWIGLAGLLMVLIGGVWIAFERNLERILGFAIITEIGFNLLAISSPTGIPLIFQMILPRGLALGIWALSLTLFRRQRQGMNFSDVEGAGRNKPILTAGILFSHFSIAGLPLLAGFPVRFSILEKLAEQSIWVATLALLGSLGVMVSALRSMAALIMGPKEQSWQITEQWQEIILIGIGIVGLLAIGIFPHLVLPFLSNGVLAFEHLAP